MKNPTETASDIVHTEKGGTSKMFTVPVFVSPLQ